MENDQLVCVECGTTFEFTEGEKKFFESKNFQTPPKRCPDCRAEKRAKNSLRQKGPKTDARYPATCSRCSRQFDAPFKPDGLRPVLCRDCFRS